MAGIVFRDETGADLVSGALNVVLPDARLGGSTVYGWVEVVNASSGTHTGVRVFLVLDAAATYAAAVSDGTARDWRYVYPTASPPASGWAAPTTYAAGLALPDLAAGQKVQICVRCNPTTGTVAYPARPALICQSTGPA